MKYLLLWGMAFSLVCVLGCGGEAKVEDTTATEAPVVVEQEPAVQTSGFGTLSEESQFAAAGNAMNAFAFDLYPHLSEASANVCYSPTSLHLALAMVYAGARGATAREMANVLHLPEGPSDDADVHYTLSEISRKLSSKPRDNYETTIANAVWPRVGLPPHDFYVSLVEKHYQAEFQALEYSKPEEATRIINLWTAKRTNDRIPQLLDPGAVNSATVLVLTNALYFKARWSHPFNVSQTQDDAFWVTPDRSVVVPMMYQTEDYRYFENDFLQALEINYLDDYTMVILLPVVRDGLVEIESHLSGHLEEALAGLQEREVNVYLPRFKFDVAYDKLTAVLSALGMPSAFGGPDCDFSGIMGQPGDVHISYVVQKAFIYVYEEGTEAAAASAVVFAGLGGVDDQAATFRADHPFVYFIRHKETGAILFMGRVADPSAG